MRLEITPGVSPELAVERATVLVGPALILTTVVLACGLVVTVFSDLPSLRLFGWLSAFAMVAALVADLFILRPTAMFLINLSSDRGIARRADRSTRRHQRRPKPVRMRSEPSSLERLDERCSVSSSPS